MDFDFRTFSTRSFERFAQALSVHILGNGVMIFGDGADGGREASYDGTLNFPSDAERWSGYTVMQAKFLQTPKTPAEDASWLAAQLESDLKKFVKPRNKLRKPEYYIIVSNAKLSPQPATDRGKGGIAKVDEIFKKYSKRLGLRDYRIWHLDQLSIFLANAPDLRRSYAAWLNTSDVVSDLIENIGRRKKAFGNAMQRYLSREIRAHQPIRLQQAGHAGDNVTYIQDVFTDLPFRYCDTDEGEKNSLLLLEIINRSRDCLDQASVKQQPIDAKGRPERILLLGGPGQGKSTVSQFLAQIFRANLLSSQTNVGVTSEISNIVARTLAAAAQVGVSPPPPRRFPLRVDLPNFADYLAAAPKGTSTSILKYLVHDIARISDAVIDLEDLREWISTYPSLVILDGLDEVPPSSNRDNVIDAVNDFWDEAVDSDLLMIVTTRPQGYNDDLGANLYTEIEMTALNVGQALFYAEKLAQNRLPDITQRERVIARMRAAARSSATSRLMVSPLQVAILLALVDQRGDAPSDRWSLFEKYYAVVLEREQGKFGAVGDTMRHWGRQITALHYRAGFLLHVEAETRGKSEAFLTQEELRNLIRGQLEDEDYEGEALEKVSDELLAASTSRLVLLVQREEGRYQFEVRSLQEFMAAAFLMIGKERIVQDRLENIAGRSHWLHVFQIASSKCFSVADAGHLRDTVITICRSLNEAGSDLDQLLRTGSRLALALLDDGLAYDQPRYRRLLFSISLEILSDGPESLPQSLTQHCDLEPLRTLESIGRFVASRLDAPQDAARLLLLRCASKNFLWAREASEKIRPIDPVECARYVIFAREFPVGSPVADLFHAAFENASMVALIEGVRDKGSNFGRADHLFQHFPCLALLENTGSGSRPHLKYDEATPLSFSINYVAISGEQAKAYENIPDHVEWKPLLALRAFHQEPSSGSLANLLLAIHQNGWTHIFDSLIGLLPWPLATSLWLVRHGADIQTVMGRVRAGSFGTFADWQAAEVRWRDRGITEDDLLLWATGIFFDESVAIQGAPWSTLSLSHASKDQPWTRNVLEIGFRSESPLRFHFRRILTFVGSLYNLRNYIDLERALFLTELSPGGAIKEAFHLEIIDNIPDSILVKEELLDVLNRWGIDKAVFLGLAVDEWENSAFKLFVSRLEKYPGLVVFLGSMLSIRSSLFEVPVLDLSCVFHLKDNPHPVISGYAQIFEIFFLGPSEENIAAVFSSASATPYPIALLRDLLDGDRLTTSGKISIAQLAAKHLVTIDEDTRMSFQGVMRRIADQRLAELLRPDCWRKLELGETLLNQTQRRVNK